MKERLKDMETKIIKILDEMLVNDCRYYREGVHSYVKEKLGFDEDFGANHLKPKNEIKLIEHLDIMLDSSKYKILLNTESLQSSIKLKINP